MIIDMTKTQIERDLSLADVQEQLRLAVNNPDLVMITAPHWISPEEIESLPKFKVSDFNTDHVEEFIDGRFEKTVFHFIAGENDDSNSNT